MKKEIDLDFAQYVVPPSETFADTMRLHYGWTTPGPEQQSEAPYLAVTDGVESHIDAMRAFVALTVANFGVDGTGPDEKSVIDFVNDYQNQYQVGVYGFLEEVSAVSLRYLRGEGDDYRFLGIIGNMNSFEVYIN